MKCEGRPAGWGTTIDNRQSTIDNRQSTIDNRQSTIDNRQSTIDNPPSPVPFAPGREVNAFHTKPTKFAKDMMSPVTQGAVFDHEHEHEHEHEQGYQASSSRPQAHRPITNHGPRVDQDLESHCSVEDAIKTHEIVFAAQQSQQTGERVTLPLI